MKMRGFAVTEIDLGR